MAELLGDVADADSTSELTERLLLHARELWHADVALHERFDAQGRHLAYVMNPAPTTFIASLEPVFVEFWPQHPYFHDLAAVLTSGRVTFISDRVSQRRFRDTGLWNEVYIHLRAKDQLMLGGAITREEVWTLGLNRIGRNFGPRDRELGQFLQPRLTRLFQRHTQRERARTSAEVLAAANTSFLVVDSRGCILEFSPGARDLLAVTRTPLPANNRIPDLRRIWGSGLPPGSVIRHSVGALEAVATTAALDRPALVLLGHRDTTGKAQLAQPLTAREAETLHWLSEGKTNTEIGRLLGISPRTVAKHCEHLFAKLGVENRLGAALLRRQP